MVLMPLAKFLPIAGTFRRYYDPAPATPGKMNSRWGGFINDVGKFDAATFRYLSTRGG